MPPPELHLAPEVAEALQRHQPVVALESTLIAHGLPWPANLETAREAESAVRAAGAVPATIAVWQGQPRIGLSAAELEGLARASDVVKASRRDLAGLMVQGRTAATTVSATMFLAHAAGIRLFATGGIGGVHRGAAQTFDISADLVELARTPVAVVCAGVKSILDVPATLEWLETHAVPVLGYRTDAFPAFLLPTSGSAVETRVESPEQAARILTVHWQWHGAGVVLAQPPPAIADLEPAEFEALRQQAEAEAVRQGITGKALTPFLLTRLAELSQGRTLAINRALIVANARLAAQVAGALCIITSV
jgi:pseudouridine-5'-phosphate glycosidase